MCEHEIEVYQALQAYVYAQPEHCNGLCSWLTSLSVWHKQVYDPNAPKIDGYEFIGQAIRNSPAISRRLKIGHWISEHDGPVPEWITLAKSLMLTIKRGQLVYRDGEWQGSGESPE